MNSQSNKSPSSRLTPFFLLFALGCAHAESIKLIAPNDIIEGGLVPVTIVIDEFGADPIKSVSLSATSNPEPFREALKVDLGVPSPTATIGTRLRSATLGPLTTTVTVTHASGRTTSKQFTPGTVRKAINFNDPETLTTVFKGTFVFPSNEIGQPQKIARAKKDGAGVLEVRGLLNHPMLPVSSEHPQGFFVHTVQIKSETAPIATFNMTAALSNSPYVQLEIPSEINPASVTMTWLDSKGYSFTK